MKIDLRTCKKGDILISCHGEKLIYIDNNGFKPYNHHVEYVDKGRGSGTRTNDGHVFQNSRWPEDHNIVEIIRKV